MTQYVIVSEDGVHTQIEAENAIEAVLGYADYVGCVSDLARKAISKMDNLEECIDLFHELVFYNDPFDKIEEIYTIGNIVFNKEGKH